MSDIERWCWAAVILLLLCLNMKPSDKADHESAFEDISGCILFMVGLGALFCTGQAVFRLALVTEPTP